MTFTKSLRLVSYKTLFVFHTTLINYFLCVSLDVRAKTETALLARIDEFKVDPTTLTGKSS